MYEALPECFKQRGSRENISSFSLADYQDTIGVQNSHDRAAALIAAPHEDDDLQLQLLGFGRPIVPHICAACGL